MSGTEQTTVTTLLEDVKRGDEDALRRLFALVYDQLRELASGQRRRHGPPPETLNTTALVHQAFIKLVGTGKIAWNDRAHFMAVAATAMRQILISYARRRTASKRGGARATISLEEIEHTLENAPGFGDVKAEALIALDRAMAELGERSPRQMQVVECRYFGGMSIEETAAAVGISSATVKRDLSLAQAWLYRRMEER